MVIGKSVIVEPHVINKELGIGIISRIFSISVLSVITWRFLSQVRTGIENRLEYLALIVSLLLAVFVILNKADYLLEFTGLRLSLYFSSLIITALLEEFVFRKVLFLNLSKTLNNLYIGAFVSSFVFGLVHLLNSIAIERTFDYFISQSIIAFVFGFIMCAVYFRTGSFISTVILHFLFNIVFGIKRIETSQLQEINNTVNNVQSNYVSDLIVGSILLLLIIGSLLTIRSASAMNNQIYSKNLAN